MASRAKSDQVLLGIGSGLAAKLFVVNLKIGHRAARLASPTVPAEHLVTKLVVQFGIQAQTCALWCRAVHEAFSIAWSRNAFLSSLRKELEQSQDRIQQHI